MWECIYFLKTLFSFPLGMYSIVELLGYVVDLLLTFWGTFILFSMLWNQFIFPSVVYDGSFFFFLMASLPELVLPCLLDDDHFDRCEVIIFHCSFDLHFPADVILCIFSCVRCPFWCPLLHNISLAVLLDFSLPQIVVRE